MFEWVKVVHILAVISWMAGLLYLPRLMVYHADSVVGSDQDATFKVMERRLLKGIMRPAALAVVGSGLGLVHMLGFGGWWLLGKALGVAGLLCVHGMLESHVVKFSRGLRNHSALYFRVLNEVPTVCLIAIVIFVVVKPFS